MMEDILSPEEGNSCNSSRASNMSEKRMADFDGEDMMSEEEELAMINTRVANAAAVGNQHFHEQLATIATLYGRRSQQANRGASKCLIQ